MPKEDPKVSVIIPTYNRAHLVGRAIQSVLNQTFKDFELIVVDDGSTDNTDDIIKEFQKKDDRITYLKHKKNKGGSAARNAGIKASRGEYIAFQDSDDEWLSKKLEKQMRVFNSASLEIGVVYTGFWRIENNRKIYIPASWVVQKEGKIYKELLKGNFVTTQSILVRKVCFDRVGYFDEDLPRLQDWELVIRLSKYYDFKCIDESLLTSHFTPDSISANQDALIKAFKLILEKHYEEFKANRGLLARHQGSIGSLLCQSGELNQGRKYLLKAMKSYPLNPKYLIAVFVSLFGEGAYSMVVRLLMSRKYRQHLDV